MKTVVSIPDDIYAEVERTARQLGIRRSELVTRAIEEFIGNHQRERLTEKLNAVYVSDQEAAALATAEAEVAIEALRRLTGDDAW